MEEIEEEWRISEDYPGYQFSNLGRLKLKNGEISKASPSTIDGYVGVTIYYGSKDNCLKTDMHILIAKIFILNPENKKCVNHINGIRHDNRVVNLEWINKEGKGGNNSSEKMLFPNNVGRSKKLVQYDRNMIVVKIWDQKKLAIEFYKGSRTGMNSAIEQQFLYRNHYWRLYQDVLTEEYIDEEWNEVEYKGYTLEISNYGRVKYTNWNH